MVQSSDFWKVRALQRIILTIGVSTNNSASFTYKFVQYIDPRPDDAVDGMIYYSNPISDCSVAEINFHQPVSDSVQFSVSISFVHFFSNDNLVDHRMQYVCIAVVRRSRWLRRSKLGRSPDCNRLAWWIV